MKIQDRRGGATAAADLLTTTISMETHGPCGPGIFNQWLVAHTQKPNSNIAKNLQRVKTFEEDTTPSLKTTFNKSFLLFRVVNLEFYELIYSQDKRGCVQIMMKTRYAEIAEHLDGGHGKQRNFFQSVELKLVVFFFVS